MSSPSLAAPRSFSRIMRVRSIATGACIVAMLVSATAQPGSAASSGTVVSATIPEATTLAIDPVGTPAGNCMSAVAGRTDLGTVLPDAKAVTTLDCDVTFGSSNSTAMLRVFQTDLGGQAMRAAPPASTVRGYWPLNSSSLANLGTTGSATDMTLSTNPNDPAFTTGGAPLLGDALDFDSNDRALVPVNAGLTIPNDFTVEAWFRTSTLSGSNRVIVQRSNTTGCTTTCNYSLEYSNPSNQMCFSISIAAGGRYTCSAAGSGTPYADGAWHYIVGTMDSTNIRRLYVDGVLIAGPSGNSGPADPSPNQLAIGSSAALGNHFIGQIDEVRLQSVARTPEEIRSYYLGTVADYLDDGTADWDTVATRNLFGACLRAATSGAAFDVSTWTPDAACPALDGTRWHAIPATATAASKVVHNGSTGDADSIASLRFGFRTRSDQAPGTYFAPVTFEVVAPNS